MDRKDYQYIHNSLGKNNQINTTSRANNYIHNLLPKINKQNIIYDNNGSGIYNNNVLKIYDKDLTNIITKNKESGAIIFCDSYSESINDGALVFCAWLQAKTTYILNCLNRYRTIDITVNPPTIKPIQPIQAFIMSGKEGEFYKFNLKNIGNSNDDSYCYFYNQNECLMAFYIPNCAPAENLIINNNIVCMTNVKPPLETAVQLIASDVPYTLDLNEQITGINNITPYSADKFENNAIKLEDIIQILNETPVELTINTNGNIEVAQIKNQTVIDFLKNNKIEQQNQDEPIYPRYQLVLIPWRDFLTERECSSRKSTWKYVQINADERQRQLSNNYKIFNSRYTCLFGHPYYESQNQPLDFSYLMSTLPKCNMPFVDNTITCLQNIDIAYELKLNSTGGVETGTKLIAPLMWKKIYEQELPQGGVETSIYGLYFNPIYKEKNSDGSYKYKLPQQGYVNPLVVASRLEKGCGLLNNNYNNIDVYYGLYGRTPQWKSITYKDYAALSFSWGLIDISYRGSDSDAPIRNLDKLADSEYELPFTKIWWHGDPQLLPYNFIGSMSKPIIVPFNSNISNTGYNYTAKEITVNNTKFESIECIQLKNSQ